MNWRDVPGYEGLYQVSDYGEVRSLPRVVGRHVRSELHTMNPHLTVRGDYEVSLCKEGRYSVFAVHTLVAMAFMDFERGTGKVWHIDGDKTNNRVTNLRIGRTRKPVFTYTREHKEIA